VVEPGNGNRNVLIVVLAMCGSEKMCGSCFEMMGTRHTVCANVMCVCTHIHMFNTIMSNMNKYSNTHVFNYV
jgi:hypothetical protein